MYSINSHTCDPTTKARGFESVRSLVTLDDLPDLLRRQVVGRTYFNFPRVFGDSGSKHYNNLGYGQNPRE